MYKGNHLHGFKNAEGIHVHGCAIVSRAFLETSQVCTVKLAGDGCLKFSILKPFRGRWRKKSGGDIGNVLISEPASCLRNNG